MKISNFSNLQTIGTCHFAKVTVERKRWFRAPTITVEGVFRPDRHAAWSFLTDGSIAPGLRDMEEACKARDTMAGVVRDRPLLRTGCDLLRRVVDHVPPPLQGDVRAFLEKNTG